MTWSDLRDRGWQTIEQCAKLAGKGLRLVLDEEVARVEPAAADLARPWPPDAEHVVVEARQGAAGAPEDEDRALDAAPAAVGVVVLAIDGRSRAVVLADRLHGGGVVQEAPVGGHELRRIPARRLAEP